MNTAHTAFRSIYFHHIPKTAGTSLRDFLVERLGERNVTPPLRGGRMRDALREYARFAAIAGHLEVSLGDRLPEDRVTVTLLRDPIDRVASAFYFQRHAYRAGRRGADGDAHDLDAWLASLDDEAALALNAHVRALWPLGWDSPREPTIDEQVSAAKRAIDIFDVVGLQSAIDESLVLLAARAHLLPPEDTPYSNRTPGRPLRHQLPVDAVRRLQALLAPDIDIYEHALRAFAQRRLRMLRATAVSHVASGAIDLSDELRGRASNAAAAACDGDLKECSGDAVRGAATKAVDRAVCIRDVAMRGEISEANYLQIGETAVMRVRIGSTVAIEDLNIGFSVRDATDALVFATNTRSLGERICIAPGIYDAHFRFANTLGLGDYRISASVHEGGSPVGGYLHHIDDACEFFVVDRLTEYFEGRVHLHVNVAVSAVSDDGRVAMTTIDAPGHERFALLAQRNPALDQFSARLEPLAALPFLRCAADAMLDVEVTNTSDATWGAFGKRAVAVSYHWLDAERRPVVFDGLRTSLPHDVRPGECVRLGVFLRAPEQTGRMTLVLTLVQEDVAWFNDREADSCAEFQLDVS